MVAIIEHYVLFLGAQREERRKIKERREHKEDMEGGDDCRRRLLISHLDGIANRNFSRATATLRHGNSRIVARVDVFLCYRDSTL